MILPSDRLNTLTRSLAVSPCLTCVNSVMAFKLPFLSEGLSTFITVKGFLF